MAEKKSLVMTKSDMFSLIEYLDWKMASSYKTDIADSTSPLSEQWEEYLRKWMSNASLDSKLKEDVSKACQQIKSDLSNRETIEITLAFDPERAFIERLYQWFTRNVSNGIVLQISVNSQIVGGAIVVYKGFYSDLSLEKKLDTYFASHKLDAESIQTS